MAAVVGLAALEALIAQEVLNQVIGQAVYQVLGNLLAPELTELGEVSQQAFVDGGGTHALDVGSVVDAYIKGHISDKDALEQLQFWGQSEAHFRILADTAGEPIPLLTAMEAWRRGFIPAKSSDPNAPSLEKAIRDSRLKNVWFDTVQKLQYQLPPVGTIIEGWLRAQITPTEALDLANKAGVDKDTATLMFKAAGRPPSPQELFTLWKRGVIPKDGVGGDTLSLNQGYLETDLKDKWYAAWTALAEYRPPPRTITALQRAGALDDAAATKLYLEEGLTPEMAALYVKTAHHERSAAAKELTKAEWLAMYVDQAIDAPTLKAKLATLGFTGESADLEIQLADLKVSHALEQRAVNRVGTLYTGRRIDKTMASNTLQGLKLPAAQIERLLAVWSAERADNLKHLTSTVLAWAVKETIMSGDQAIEELTRQGYGPRDAWLELSYHLKAPVTPTMPSDNLPPS